GGGGNLWVVGRRAVGVEVAYVAAVHKAVGVGVLVSCALVAQRQRAIDWVDAHPQVRVFQPVRPGVYAAGERRRLRRAPDATPPATLARAEVEDAATVGR